MAAKRKIIVKNKEAKIKQVNWLALWLEWTEEGLAKQWRLRQVSSDHALSRVVFWLNLILKNIIVQQVQMNALSRQVEALEQWRQSQEAGIREKGLGVRKKRRGEGDDTVT